MRKKSQKHLENAIGIFAWISGLLIALAVGIGVYNGSIRVPNILADNLFSEILAFLIIGTTILTIILSFFRK